MRRERFLTQARLLSSVREDGWIASAIDTHNTYQYITGSGWAQLVPATDPISGATLVAGQPLVAQGTGSVAYAAPEKLLPDVGDSDPGEILIVGPTAAPEYQTRDVTGGIAMPVDFSSGVLTNFTNLVIDGGALGANGWLRATFAITVITNANRTVTLEFPGFSLDSTTNTSALTYLIQGVWSIQNQASENVNRQWAKISNHRFDPVSNTSTQIADVQQIQNGATNTDTDWNFILQIFASSAITGQATVDACAIEYAHIP